MLCSSFHPLRSMVFASFSYLNLFFFLIVMEDYCLNIVLSQSKEQIYLYNFSTRQIKKLAIDDGHELLPANA